MITIEEIQAGKVCQTFDCKSIQITPKTLAAPIVAMANADGGVLVIGFSDKTRRIEGVDGNEERLNDMKVQMNNNKIYAPLKDKWLVANPKEEVRQKCICRLVDSYGYDINQMDQELKVTNSQRGQGAARADIVIWKSTKDKADSKRAFILLMMNSWRYSNQLLTS